MAASVSSICLFICSRDSIVCLIFKANADESKPTDDFAASLILRIFSSLYFLPEAVRAKLIKWSILTLEIAEAVGYSFKMALIALEWMPCLPTIVSNSGKTRSK